MGMFLGTLLDGVPESFILGSSLAAGGAVSVAFLAAIFISNVPEAVAGSLNLKAIGYTDRHVFGMWSAIVVASGIGAGAGYLVAQSLHVDGLYAQAFAGGAVLTMLADSMMPQAFENGGTWVGLLTVLGYLFAAALSVAR
jgi:ZIP family zinc transporter